MAVRIRQGLMGSERRFILGKHELVCGLRSVGLGAGDHVVVHSRLSSFGYVEGGADAVMDALEEVLTPQGTLVMPTYSGELIFFFEALALRCGINGSGASGRGVVFDGEAGGLWRELKTISEEAGISYPFGSVGDLHRRFSGERKRIMEPNGWDMRFDGSTFAESTQIQLVRNARPLPAEEVEPWRMPAWTGIIPNTFWRRPGTIRSHQYSGSFAAWGKLANRILQGHDNTPGQRLEDHPLYRMKEAGGRILLIGVDHRANSTIHVAEWVAVRDCGVELPESWKEFVGDFQAVDQPLDRQRGQARGRIGDAEVRLVETRKLFEVVREILELKISRELHLPAGQKSSRD